MTVWELLKSLEKLDKDMPVCIVPFDQNITGEMVDVSLDIREVEFSSVMPVEHQDRSIVDTVVVKTGGIVQPMVREVEKKKEKKVVKKVVKKKAK